MLHGQCSGLCLVAPPQVDSWAANSRLLWGIILPPDCNFCEEAKDFGFVFVVWSGKTNREPWEGLKFHNNVLWKSFESLWVDEIFYGLIMTTMRGRMEGWSTKIDSIVRNILASPAFQRHIDSASETYNILQRTLVLTFLPKYHPSSLNLKMTQLRYC